MNLEKLAIHIADGLVNIDKYKLPFRTFQAGVGPYGEPQLLRLIAEYLNNSCRFQPPAITKRTPDLLIPNEWALEFKITRPFGDNGNEAENWSVNLIHPYPGNVSTIGDCHKLLGWSGPERKAVIVVGYEHVPAKIHLRPLIDSFEAIAKHVARIQLSSRVECRRAGLIHPVHQSAIVFAWEVLGVQE